ncbi:helix-turn-helix domain-containing protein [Thalassococcus lentus]|uniref:Helix-turn-helix domain-containing protein n=1 Tax=Thalassococcus lentus TaxID=1210524 RepID=A0ABT4XTN8_9RHOB|nr:helix-turn-helix domain-containing protein [Thalassococcus lentus]MDA7425298.1 helix-turn-helix domain-containing protein [Thalassococcus lentus]
MSSISQFIFPPKELASCIVGGIYRDTRGVALQDEERLNYFPASPFFAASIMLEGQLHVADELMPLHQIKRQPVSPARMYAKPKSAPHMSWSPGPIAGLTVAFYPDAWATLGGGFDGTPPDCLPSALAHFETHGDAQAWSLFWDEMKDAWAAALQADRSARWNGSDRIKSWTYYLMSRAAQSGTGRSLRSAQRRVRRWTGHSMQTLNLFAQIDDLHALIATEPSTAPVELAASAGFADQSHMGRALKRVTGFSPVHLNQRIAEDEAFWCYRLLGERF